MQPDQEKRKQLESIVKMLAERLALAVVYLHAIDDSVDPFSDPDVDKAWHIASLATAAKAGVFEGAKAHEPWDMDVSAIIEASQGTRKVSVIDTPAYQQSLTSIRKMVRDGFLKESKEPLDRPAGVPDESGGAES